jgi:MFS family permease
MRDLGFTADRSRGMLHEVRSVLRASLDYGVGNAPVRWWMLAGLCSGGVGIYGFYAAQPFLLQLYGNPNAFGVAGIAAAVVPAAQIASGFAAPYVRYVFVRRTSVLLFASAVSALALWLMSQIPSFVGAAAVLALWSFMFWIGMPLRQTYLNGIIPSAQRATVLSFDNLMASAGGVVAQPGLGRIADVSGYGYAYFVSAAIQLSSLPFIALARRTHAASDRIEVDQAADGPPG